MVLTDGYRLPALSPFSAQLNDAIVRQKQRMELAFVAEQQARGERRTRGPDPLATTSKHPIEAESSAEGAKRAKIEGLVERDLVSNIDVTSIPVDTVIQVVMAGLEAVTTERLRLAFEVSQHIRLFC